jgi:hypothetical protein
MCQISQRAGYEEAQIRTLELCEGSFCDNDFDNGAISAASQAIRDMDGHSGLLLFLSAFPGLQPRSVQGSSKGIVFKVPLSQNTLMVADKTLEPSSTMCPDRYNRNSCPNLPQ